MKTILSILFLLITVTVTAQEIISQTQEVIQRDTFYFLQETTVTENGTPYPDTVINVSLIGDSTTTANKLFDVAHQPVFRVAEGMKAALQFNQAASVYNAVNPLFQSLTGQVLSLDAANRFFGSLQGRYRVFDQVGNNFSAEIIQLPNGALRLRRESDQTMWVVQSLGPDMFRLLAFDHDGNGSTANWWFFWDGVSAERKMYFPAERVSGATTIFRIVKTQ